MDITSLLGIFVGVGAVLGGQLLEGGRIASLFQLTAGVIVVGGTLGATLLSATSSDLRRAAEMFPLAFRRPSNRAQAIIDQFFRMATLSRKNGIVDLEELCERMPDDFMCRAVQHVVDGTSESVLRNMLERDLDTRLEADWAGARIYETAGGYAPTIGIIGAVLGLIHAMQSLSRPGDLGQGIAVAFVATIYGVGFANLFLLPIASRLRRLIAISRLHDEMIIEGAIALQAGHPPRAIRERLSAFLTSRQRRATEAQGQHA